MPNAYFKLPPRTFYGFSLHLLLCIRRRRFSKKTPDRPFVVVGVWRSYTLDLAFGSEAQSFESALEVPWRNGVSIKYGQVSLQQPLDYPLLPTHILRLCAARVSGIHA